MQREVVGDAVAAARAAIGSLLSIDRSACHDAVLLAEIAAVEVLARQLDAVRVAQVAELDMRGAGQALGYVNTGALLTDLLRLAPAEAKGRVLRAQQLGPRRELTGATLDPTMPVAAAALGEGAISTAHVTVIATCLERMPAEVRVAVGEQAETFLVEQAYAVNPRTLTAIAARLLATVDPDGVQPREQQRRRRRNVTISKRPDGSFVLHGEVTEEFVATWQPILDTLSRPQPIDPSTDAATGDDRDAAQRRHDAMLEAGQRLLRSGTLPDAGGAPVTVVVTMTERDLRERTGTATTEHGDPIPVEQVLAAAGEAEIIPVVLTDAGGVVCYGRTRRLASPSQRRALAARDGGCSFPGCTRPASWCQVNHIVRWEHGGLTTLENLHLLCGYHHREFQRRGWTPCIRDGVVEWLPPAWFDPLRRPIRNTAQHVPDFEFGVTVGA